MNTTTSKLTILGAVNRQLILAREPGPTFEQAMTHAHFKRFATEARRKLEEVRSNPLAAGWLTAEEAEVLAGTLEALVELLGEELTGFMKTAAMVAAGRRSGMFYSAECHKAAANVGELVGTVRTMLGDVLENNDPEAQATRETFAVGQPIRFGSPVEVQRAGEQQLAAFRDPVNVAYLEGHSVPVGVLVRRLETGLAALDVALDAGPGQQLAALRTQRDDHAVRVEILAARILVTVTALLGRKKRNELRAFFPVNRRPKRGAGDNPAPGNEVTVDVGGTQPLSRPQPGVAAPAVSAAKEGGEKGSESVASGSMFGSRVVAPVLAAGGTGEPVKAAGAPTAGNGSTGPALPVSGNSTGVNGSNGHTLMASGVAHG